MDPGEKFAFIQRGPHLLRPSLALALLLSAPPLAAEPAADAPLEQRLATLAEHDAPLLAARRIAADCEEGCLTPSEALRLVYDAGEGEARTGRFLLDIEGGGQSFHGALGELFFVSSRQDYARFGTLTIAFEPSALRDLLRRASVCDVDRFRPGTIEVTGCYAGAPPELNIFTMIERLGGRRIVVEGEARLQWIDARTGLPRTVANKRGEHEAGYYQVWVRVEDADQVIFVADD